MIHGKYESFQELCQDYYHMKPTTKTTKDPEKLKSQQEKFLGRHKCKACGELMTWIPGTSTMVCKNEKCKGIKISRTDNEGNEIISYVPSYDLLDTLGFEIAQNIFGEA